MPLQRQLRIVWRHPLAVVFDADQALAAVLDRHRHPPCAGVDAFSTSSLTTEAGPLDDLAGGDLVGERDGEAVNLRHRRCSRRYGGGAAPRLGSVTVYHSAIVFVRLVTCWSGAPQSQCFFLKNPSMTTTVTTMPPTSHQNGRGSGSLPTNGSFMFMP